MEKLEYTVIRSGRKTISVNIGEDGRVTIRAPYRTTDKFIADFVESKREWIKKHTSAAGIRNERRTANLKAFPAELPLFGKMAAVKSEPPYGYTDGEFHLPAEFSLEKMLPYLEKLYKLIAKEYIVPRAYEWAEKMGTEISAVRINSAKSRWGSCSAGGNINFSWRLAAAPPEVIDYVIVHELCHIGCMDHSKAFWDKVGSVIPDYEVKREYLKTVHAKLIEYGAG